MKKVFPPTVENGWVRWRVVGGNTIHAAFSSRMRTTATPFDSSLPVSATFPGGRPPRRTRPRFTPRLRFALFGFDYTQPTAELW